MASQSLREVLTEAGVMVPMSGIRRHLCMDYISINGAPTKGNPNDIIVHPDDIIFLGVRHQIVREDDKWIKQRV